MFFSIGSAVIFVFTTAPLSIHAALFVGDRLDSLRAFDRMFGVVGFLLGGFILSNAIFGGSIAELSISRPLFDVCVAVTIICLIVDRVLGRFAIIQNGVLMGVYREQLISDRDYSFKLVFSDKERSKVGRDPSYARAVSAFLAAPSLVKADRAIRQREQDASAKDVAKARALIVKSVGDHLWAESTSHFD